MRARHSHGELWTFTCESNLHDHSWDVLPVLCPNMAKSNPDDNLPPPAVPLFSTPTLYLMKLPTCGATSSGRSCKRRLVCERIKCTSCTSRCHLYPMNLFFPFNWLTLVSSRYVNYATGNEPIEEKYGYCEDRLKKLRDLKTEWDPKGKFSHYHPIHWWIYTVLANEPVLVVGTALWNNAISGLIRPVTRCPDKSYFLYSLIRLKTNWWRLSLAAGTA
jgi:hypothetical protein